MSRFEVHTLVGYGLYGHYPSTSYWVADRAYGFREVATFYAPHTGNQRKEQRRKLAEAACAELNAWHSSSRSEHS